MQLAEKGCVTACLFDFRELRHQIFAIKLAPTTHAERLIKFQMLATSTTNGSL
jgi:hypothetical protein